MKAKQKLTNSELQVMECLWQLPESKGFGKDITERFPDPKPAYNTIATFLQILEKKGFVESFHQGRKLIFHALVSHDEYARFSIKDTTKAFFGGSFARLVSFFAKEENLSKEEIDEIVNIIKEGKK